VISPCIDHILYITINLPTKHLSLCLVSYAKRVGVAGLTTPDYSLYYTYVRNGIFLAQGHLIHCGKEVIKLEIKDVMIEKSL